MGPVCQTATSAGWGPYGSGSGRWAMAGAARLRRRRASGPPEIVRGCASSAEGATRRREADRAVDGDGLRPGRRLCAAASSSTGARAGSMRQRARARSEGWVSWARVKRSWAAWSAGQALRGGGRRRWPAAARGGARCARGSSAGALAESCPEVSPW